MPQIDYQNMTDDELKDEMIVVCDEGHNIVMPHITRLLTSEGEEDKMDSLIRLAKSMDLEEELLKITAMGLNVGFGMGVWHERGVNLDRLERLMSEMNG